MNANLNTIARNYGSLTPEERFRLIFAASGRGDETERDRLAKSSRRVTFSRPDHSTYSHAFLELANMVFLELLDYAALYLDLYQQEKELAYAAGFILRTNADGWKMFCDRMNVPAWLLWEFYPGFDRLRRALALAEKAAFDERGMLAWGNRVRKAGEPEVTALALTVEGVAAVNEASYRNRVEWWGG